MTKTKLIAFHGKQEIKDKYIARIKAHAKADEIIKGTYWKDGKGCAVGCTIHGCKHASYEEELGIPSVIARLEEGIFEGLPNEIAKGFPLRFLKSIPVGADLSMVWPKFAIWLLGDPDHGVIRIVKKEQAKSAIQNIIDLYEKVIMGREVAIQEWEAAVTAASVAHSIDVLYTAVAAANADTTNTATAVAAYTAYTTYAALAAAAGVAIAYNAGAVYANIAAAYAADGNVAYAAAAEAVKELKIIESNGTRPLLTLVTPSRAYVAAYAAVHVAAARESARVKQANKLIKLLKECK